MQDALSCGGGFSWDWERLPRHHLELSSGLDLASSLRTIALVRGRGLDNATMNGRHFQFRSGFSCCLIVDFSHFSMASCSCTIYISSHSLPSVASRPVCYFKASKHERRQMKSRSGRGKTYQEKMKLLMGLRWNRWHSFAMRRLWAPLVYRGKSQAHFPHFSSGAIDKPALSWLINRLSDWQRTADETFHFKFNL